MNRSKKLNYWTFISDNIVALSAVAAGVIVLIWQSLTDASNLNPVSAAILVLLCLLTTSEIVESRKRFDTLQETVDEQFPKILSLLPPTEVKRFPDSESAISYLSNLVRDAEKSVEQASLDIIRSRAKSTHERFLQIRNEVIMSGNVRFQYLFQANNDRIKRVKGWIERSVTGKFFAAGYEPIHLKFPMMTFAILDGKELFARSPYEIGENEVYIATQHPEIVALYSQWFNQLWNSACKIDPMLPISDQISELNRLLNQKS